MIYMYWIVLIYDMGWFTNITKTTNQYNDKFILELTWFIPQLGKPPICGWDSPVVQLNSVAGSICVDVGAQFVSSVGT